MHRVALFLLIFNLSLSAFADYAWIPKYQSLDFKFGLSRLSSDENFADGGFVEDITVTGAPGGTKVDFSAISLWVKPEYGFAKDWSASLFLNVIQNRVKPVGGGSALLDGSGFGDLVLGIKRRLQKKFPVMTGEVVVVVPTYSKTPGDPAKDLVRGDGAFELGLRLHTGLSERFYFFVLTPGIRIRLGGYATAFNLFAAAGARYSRFYGLLFADLLKSFGSELLNDSSFSVHDAPGAGGTYARLSGSPSAFAMGLKLGARLIPRYYVELAFSNTLSGKRSANYSLIVVNFKAMFNFFKPVRKIPIKEVPFKEGDVLGQL